MTHITSMTGKQYYIPVFLAMTFFEYKELIYNYRLTQVSQIKPKPKPRE